MIFWFPFNPTKKGIISLKEKDTHMDSWSKDMHHILQLVYVIHLRAVFLADRSRDAQEELGS